MYGMKINNNHLEYLGMLDIVEGIEYYPGPGILLPTNSPLFSFPILNQNKVT